MRWLILLALLPALAFADGVRICTTMAGSTCTATQWSCEEKLASADVYVRTETAGWLKWGAITATTNVRTCKAGAPDGWLAKAASGVTVGSTPVTPPVVPVVSLGDVLSWAADPLAASFRVYQGTAPDVYGAPVNVATNRYQIPRLQPGTYYFAVSAVGATGIETEKAAAPAPLTVSTGPETPKTMTCTPAVVSGLSATLTCSLK